LDEECTAADEWQKKEGECCLGEEGETSLLRTDGAKVESRKEGGGDESGVEDKQENEEKEKARKVLRLKRRALRTLRSTKNRV